MMALSSIPATTNNMDIEFSSLQQIHLANEVADEQKAKRTKSPGIRLVGSRIYDSSNGITCHQCRQKTRDLAASCKNLKKGKPCTIKFCHRCLKNRYGEEVAEVQVLSNWKCPKCRGRCNCSCCRKRQGLEPTGQLVHTAKASGFNSVSDMLHGIPHESLESDKKQILGVDNFSCDDRVPKSNAVSHMKPIASEKDLVVVLSGEPGKENSLDENGCVKLDSRDVQKTLPETSKKRRREGLKEISNGNSVEDACQNRRPRKSKICDEVPEMDSKRNANDANMVLPEAFEKETKVVRNHDVVYGEMDGPEKWVANDFFIYPMTSAPKDSVVNPVIPLPPGTMLADVSDVELPPEDVGNALQFLEFCRVFEKVLDVKEGEAEAILRELVPKQTLRRSPNTLAVQFHVRMLTLILIDSGKRSTSLSATNGKNSWLKALEDLISGSDILKDFQLDWLKKGISGYYDLDLSEKLSLLNFLCDEALGTEKLRNYIDEQNSIFVEEVKEAKSKVAAAKEKEKSLKQKLQAEVAKAIVPNEGVLSISEHNALVSKIKSEAAQAHAEMLEAKGTVPKRKQSSDVMRINPVLLDESGHVFWQLKSYTAEYAVLMQDIKVEDADVTAADERWFVYGSEEKDEIDKYISSRAKGPKAHKVSHIL